MERAGHRFGGLLFVLMGLAFLAKIGHTKGKGEEP
jgi:hypothetical protein